MTVAPIFLLWDESIPTDVGSHIRNHLDSVFEGVRKNNGLDIRLSMQCMAVEGSHLVSVVPMTQYSSGMLNRVGTGGTGNPISLHKLDIEAKIKDLFGTAQSSDVLPPVVIVVAGRPWSSDFDSRQLVTDLFRDKARPRLIVLDKSSKFSWLASLTDQDQIKRAKFIQLTDVVTDVDQHIRGIGDWLVSKASQVRPALSPLSQGSAQDTERTSSVVVSPTTPPAPATQSRPTISLTDEPAITSSPPKPQQSPSATVSQLNTTPTVVTSPVSSEPQISTVNTPLAESKETSPTANTQTGTTTHSDGVKKSEESIGANTRSPSRRDRRKDAKKKWRGPRLNLGRRKRLPITPIAEVSPSQPELPLPNAPEIAATTTLGDAVQLPTIQLAADGQLIVDKGSSINARSWLHPEWKKLPANGPSRDLEIEFGSMNDLRVFAGSTRGTKHQFYGDENQDAFFVARTKDSQYVVLTVADGVGSATYSAFGSKSLSFLVSRGITERIENGFLESGDMKQLVHESTKAASERMQNWAPDELYAPRIPTGGDSMHDVSSTLCVAVIEAQKSINSSRQVWLGCVGDSPCFTLNNGKWTLRSSPTKDGEVLEHGTSALPVSLGSDPVLEWFNFELLDSEILMLVSDGIGTSMVDGNTALGRWIAGRLSGNDVESFKRKMTPNELSLTLTYDRQTEDDDRTMVILFDFDGIVQSIENSRLVDDSSDVNTSQPEEMGVSREHIYPRG